MLEPDATLAGVAAAYGVSVDRAEEAELSLREFIHQRLHGDIEPGDRVNLAGFDLVVRAIDDEHHVKEVGLDVEPGAPDRRIAGSQWPSLITRLFRRGKAKVSGS